MNPKEPEWERRQEDAKMRQEVVKTLGSVQKAVDLFEKSLGEAKARFEITAGKLSDKVDELDEQLNGTAKDEGFFQWMHQADRNIKALVQGVLGLDGANYEKSLKGKLEKAITDIKELHDAVDSQQIATKLEMDSRVATRTHRTTIRGQNIFVWVAIIGLIGTITAASVREWQPALWAKILGKKPTITTPAPGRGKASRKPKARPKRVEPTIAADEEPEAVESKPAPDMTKPQRAPMSPY